MCLTDAPENQSPPSKGRQCPDAEAPRPGTAFGRMGRALFQFIVTLGTCSTGDQSVTVVWPPL